MFRIALVFAVVAVGQFTLEPGLLSCNGDEVSEPVNLTGTICDTNGMPVSGATVRVWTASVKRGYSTYCPSCYADCGKRATTDSEGAFVIQALSPDLKFRLLIVNEGFAPTFIEKVDPSETPVNAAIPRREAPQRMSHVVRGQVVGSTGQPIRDAVIEPELVWFVGEDGRLSGKGGAVKGLDPLAVTNDVGEFEVAYAKAAVKMSLIVRGRGTAPKRFSDLTTGENRHTLSVGVGATIRGRLLHEGEPVQNAEVGLVSKDRQSLVFFSEERIGTQSDGTFLFSNVPVPGKWYVYAKMNSIVRLGATEPVECATEHDDESIEIGDIAIKPGHRLRGQVILTDGNTIAEGMRIFINAERAWDAQTAILPPDGRFEFNNLPTDDYTVFTSVKGYRLSSKNPNLSWVIEGAVDRPIDEFLILLDPGEEDFAGRSGGKFRGKALKSAPRP